MLNLCLKKISSTPITLAAISVIYGMIALAPLIQSGIFHYIVSESALPRLRAAGKRSILDTILCVPWRGILLLCQSCVSYEMVNFVK